MMTNTDGDIEAPSSKVTCSCPFCPPLCSPTLVLAPVGSLLSPPQRGPLLPAPTAPAWQLSWVADRRKLLAPEPGHLLLPPRLGVPMCILGAVQSSRRGGENQVSPCLRGQHSRVFLRDRVAPFKSQLKCMCIWELRFQSQRAGARILPPALPRCVLSGNT